MDCSVVSSAVAALGRDREVQDMVMRMNRTDMPIRGIRRQRDPDHLGNPLELRVGEGQEGGRINLISAVGPEV